VALQNAFQAEALIVAGDFARDADVVHGRHVDQEAAGSAMCEVMRAPFCQAVRQRSER
jgi:hypothetical protein